jgi:hypothetical protein
MTSQIVTQFGVIASGGKTTAQLKILMQGVALDTDLLRDYGLSVQSDVTSIASSLVQRAITLSMNPGVSATATAVLVPGNVASSVQSVAMGVNGSDYVAVPVVTIAPPIAGNRQALAHANLGVVSVSVTAPGSGYSAKSFVQFSKGQVPPGSPDATAVLSFGGGGTITGVTVATAGGPYGIIPTVTVVDPTGAGNGAILVAHLQVASITVDDPGNGYATAPAVTIAPLFHAMFPDSGDQVSPLWNWMTEVFQQAVLSPVITVAPVVS